MSTAAEQRRLGPGSAPRRLGPQRAAPPSATPTSPSGPKHPLNGPWVLWFNSKHAASPRSRLGDDGTQSSWGEELQRVTTLATVEDFWCLFNNILPPERLPAQSDYSLFRENIRPMWEDQFNEKGGKWTLTVPKQHRRSLDGWWLHALLGCIGEALTQKSSEICGIVVSVRKSQDRISIWTKTATDAATQKEIGQALRDLLKLPAGDELKLQYQAHADAYSTTTTYGDRKTLYEV